jgi:hypothetical protein
MNKTLILFVLLTFKINSTFGSLSTKTQFAPNNLVRNPQSFRVCGISEGPQNHLKYF